VGDYLERPVQPNEVSQVAVRLSRWSIDLNRYLGIKNDEDLAHWPPAWRTVVAALKRHGVYVDLRRFAEQQSLVFFPLTCLLLRLLLSLVLQPPWPTLCALAMWPLALVAWVTRLCWTEPDPQRW
jgi:hypothetical protein